MATAFKVDVLSPTGALFTGEVERLSTKTVSGEIGVLAGHQPLLGRLAPGNLKLILPGGDEKTFKQFGGYLQVAVDGDVLVLIEQGWDSEESHPEREADIVRIAEARIDTAEAGTSEHTKATTFKRHIDNLLA